MTAVGKLARTTAFKLSVAYLAIFAVGAALVLANVGGNVKALIDEQISQTVDAELTGLAEQYQRGGIRQLVQIVEERTRRPGSSLYLVTNFAGEPLAGNIVTLPAGVLARPALVETAYQRAGEADARHNAMARVFVLPAGFRLLVGRDLEERDSLRQIIIRATLSSVAWLVVIGIVGGVFVARRVLARVDAMNASAARIMTGDLSDRLPLSGTGDELDRLAQNLNAMLERIVALMHGLREVSDNIAHDLKTPLTRLRNGAEEALRTAKQPAEYHAAMERVIDESDGLIRIFNALLMIARTESGMDRTAMAPIDMSDIVRDVAELYEPLAEQEQVRLTFAAGVPGMVTGNRELISLALANLIDNALKYGRPTGGAERVIDVGLMTRADDMELSVSDHGPGIPVSDRLRVLDRFVRLEGARSLPGSGLGLALAAAVAKLHGGSLRLESNDPGLRVVLALPKKTESGSGLLSVALERQL